ncbi:sigma-70 family RNA polymerase sigma factor [Marmoricola sp. URHA0025 HA25]
MTLAAAQAGDHDAFAELVAPHRHELRVHCYRMLGSADDADDAVQETLVASWRGIGGFEQRSSLRAWLYRIATNVCLRMADQRKRRILSWDHGPARSPDDDLGMPEPGPWLEPWTDPDAAYERKETIGLAFVAALQHLPPNQRAVLILRDVLDFSAAEVADQLDTSVASVTSALQRARQGVEARVPDREQSSVGVAEIENAVVTAFVDAFERRDVDALVSLLAEDVRFTMPPLPTWFDGREDVGGFFARRVFATPWRARPVQVNGQPALACYQEVDGELRLSALNVLTIAGGRISWIASFLDPKCLGRLGLPASL